MELDQGSGPSRTFVQPPAINPAKTRRDQSPAKRPPAFTCPALPCPEFQKRRAWLGLDRRRRVQQQRHTQADRIALGHGLTGTEARRRKFSSNEAIRLSQKAGRKRERDRISVSWRGFEPVVSFNFDDLVN